jgi:ABC-type polar amino acid transport system ATPase subunit
MERTEPVTTARAPSRPASTDIVLRVRDLHLRRGARSILRGVSFDVAKGSVVALMGPSGSGKTTILRVLAALEGFDQGRIEIDGLTIADGHALSPPSLRALRARVGLVFQFHHLFAHLTSLDNVTLAPMHVQHIARLDAEARAMTLLQTLGVEHRARAFPRELSGGEAQRVAIARALAVDPPVLMMDEPTASLDSQRRDELGELLRGLASQGRAILVSTHDESFVRGWCHEQVRIGGPESAAP